MAIDKSKFLAPFKAETKEHLDKLNEGILELEKDPHNTKILELLMKEAHTVKGSSTMMGFPEIAEIAHKMEDGFEKAPGQDITMDKSDYDLIFECLDTIESLLEGTLIRQAKSLEDAYVHELCARLEHTFSQDKDGSPSPVGATAPAEASDNATGQDETEAESESASETAETDEDKPEPAEDPAEDAPVEIDAPTAEKSTAPVATATRTTKAEESIRVEVSKLNRLMNLSGEMLTAKIRLSELIKNLTEKAEQSDQLDEEFGDLIRQLNGVDESVRLVVADMQDQTLNLRMLPVSYLFGTFPRAMRDLAKQHGKEIAIVTRGEETHLDKNIIDRMRDPLMHLLRNSVDHGIELPETRVANGKVPQGTITLIAYQAGAQVVLEISDDGHGIDLETVQERAIERGLISSRSSNNLTDEQLFQMLFASGFTTRDVVTETSGRGVGLDVVREEISQLKGSIEVFSEADKGTRFVIKLPLTLSITETLLISCGSDAFAVPIDTIVETTRIGLDDIETVEAKEVMSLRGEIVPLVRIHQMFSLPKKGIIEKRFFPVVIVQSADRRLGLLVDEILGHQDTVIKPLGDPLKNTPNIAGGTVLGDGRVVLILDVPSIVFSAGGNHTVSLTSSLDASISAEVDGGDDGHMQRRVLLAEDTPSTAMLEKSVLEAAGFFVHHTKDGQEALARAAQDSYDLVISDVLMPRMNGFELTANLKRNPATRDIPVVIVTTRGSNADKKRGMDAGADAYVLKKDFTSDTFLETIDRLLS
jgi:two-component system chemotaxis sensor kinase CheA